MPLILVACAPVVADSSTGQFCRLLGPASASGAGSLVVLPSPLRSMPRSAFEKDRVPRDRVPLASDIEDSDPIVAIEGDDVRRTGRAPEETVRCKERDSALVVSERLRSGAVGPDVVPQHLVAGAGRLESDLPVPREQIAGPRSGASDRVVVTEGPHTLEEVAQVLRAGRVGADEVARDPVSPIRSPGPVSVDARDGDPASGGSLPGFIASPPG